MSESVHPLVLLVLLAMLAICGRPSLARRHDGGLPVNTRISLIALAYGDYSDEFGEDAWFSGRSRDPSWNASLALANCLAISRAIPGGTHTADDLFNCLENAWQTLLELDWSTCCTDTPAPVFGLAFRANQAAASVSSDLCGNDVDVGYWKAYVADMRKWNDPNADHRSRNFQRQDLLGKDMNHVINQLAGPYMGPKSLCYASIAALYFALYSTEAYFACPDCLAADITYNERRYMNMSKNMMLFHERHRFTAGLQWVPGEVFRLVSPLWAVLRRIECEKYWIPSPVWSWEFLCDVLGPQACQSNGGIGPIVLEAGAHDGRDSVRMCDAWPRAVIHAMEPMPSNRAMFLERLNRADGELGTPGRVIFHEYGLSDSVGVRDMNSLEHCGRYGASSLFQPTDKFMKGQLGSSETKTDGIDVVPVQVTTLDNMLRSTRHGRFDVLRLDLEGSEVPVLKASLEALPRAKLLQVEAHADHSFFGNNLTSLRVLRRLLRPKGWRLLWTSVGVIPRSGSGDAIFLRI